MTQTSTLPLSSRDRCIVHSDITWQQFALIRAGFANSTNIRLAYYKGTIEIFMPGRDREVFSRLIGFLIGLFCLETGIEFESTGSTTYERNGEVSVQADESYCFGESKPVPDLVIEIIFTSGSSNKLQRYLALGVPEVWFWQDGVFDLYRWRGNHYDKISRSEIPQLATLNIDLLARCVLMGQTSQLESARAFRQGLKPRSNEVK